MLKITQIKSAIGYQPKAKRTLSALGLKKMNQCVEKTDTPQIRGMIKKIDYLVKVEEIQYVKLDSLKPSKGSIKNKKRIGRGHGSGLGKTSGRGHKGAGQRSGNKRRPWFEGGQMPLARRLPRRGFTNIFKEEIQIVNISDLNRIEKNSEIDPVVLQENGMIRSSLKPVKILGEGDIDKKLNVTASAFSASAKNKIEKAGGTVTIL